MMLRKFLVLNVLFLSVVAFAQKKDTMRVLDKDQEFYKQGCKLLDSAKYKDAIKLFQRALKENNVMHQAHNKIAVCKVKMKDYSAAEKELHKSLKIQPDDAATIKYLGYVYLEDKKFKEAKLYLDSAYKITKEDYELEYYMACLKIAGKDTKGALVNLENCIDLRPNFGDAWLKRGLLYFQQRNYKYCVRDLTTGLELNPGDSSNIEVFRTRGDAKFEMNDFTGAITDYSRIITVDPKNEEAYTSRGAAKIEAGDNSGAIDDETKAIDLNKNSFLAYNLRGVAKGALKTYGEAIKDLDMAIKIKPEYAAAYVNRASIKYAMNEKRKACEDLNTAERLGSNEAFRYIEAYCKGIK